MRRYIMDDLIKWKNKKNRKPLILWGARQVGKTWLMKEFGKTEFPNTVYISFYNNRKIADIFEQDYDTHRIIHAIEIEMHVAIDTNTLLIFDEVQTSPKVIESLKYFEEEAKEYPIIAAGSLLGVAIHEGVSFPVGKVDEIHLYPLCFGEFLEALDETDLSIYIQNYKNDEINSFAEKYKELLKLYYIIGGMPGVVSDYIDNRDLDEVRENQTLILSQYEGDFGKHVKATELPRIRMVWNSLPMQLAKENRKFFFGQIKKGARSKDFEIAIQWLIDSGLVYKVNKVTKPGMPLKSYIDLAAFKLYMLDVGLLGALSELDINSVINGNSIFTEFKGALTEQYVLQEIKSCTKYTPYYFSEDKSTYEVDFLIQKVGNIVPIEVKAEDNLRAKSLKFYHEKYSPAVSIRTSAAPYRSQEWLENIPLWGIGGI